MLKRFIKAIKEKVQGKPLSLRSSRWEGVRKDFLKTNNICAACGTKDKLQVHHIKPFHLYPELELEPSNLITLCETKQRKCHLNIGHLGHWKRENPDVTKDAANYRLMFHTKSKL